jgi:predicted ATP-dependent protease
LPARNESDLEDIPEDVRNELNLKTVNRINEVVEAALEETVVNPPPPVPPELLHRRPPEPDVDSQPLIAKER